MICPHCGADTDFTCRISVDSAIAKTLNAEAGGSLRLAAQALGSIGGRTTGKTKARAVDYRELARLSHQKRRENKAKKHG